MAVAAASTSSQLVGEMADYIAICDHMVAKVNATPLDRDPFCHIYLEEIFPAELYPMIIANLPPRESYTPFNLRRYARSNGESTRDMFYLTRQEMAKVPLEVAAIWRPIVRALTHRDFKQALFAKLAPDLAERFEIPEHQVNAIECDYDVVLLRDTEDYRIKPHPDGANRIVTLQFYLPPDDANIDLGTSLYRAERGLFGRRSFTEVKRMPFKANSAYAFVVSDTRKLKSWHGRELLAGFTGVRNTLGLIFQRDSERDYSV
jgi:hypothetical protein